jgi:aspartate/methionine/tyrosine aminotransferase
VRIPLFKMERMQSTYENYVEYNLSESGVQPMRAEELLEGDSPETARLLSAELGYNQSNGTEMLRDRIALFYPGAGRDNILVTNGGAEANFATFWALLERGDRVAVQIPNYFQTPGLARIFAGRADFFRLVRRKEGSTIRWALDVDSLRKAVSKKTRVILVTNPNNPTGAILSEAEMDAVVGIARRAGAWLVADEIYRGAELSDLTTPTFFGRYARVLVTSGLSKAFGLPGLRIGWVAGPAKMIQKIWSYRDYTTIAPSILSDQLARLALEPARREKIFERTRSILRTNLQPLEEWIRSHGDLFEYTPPLAGAIAWMKYKLPISSIELVERLRKEQSVLIVAGDQCGMAKHIRIGFGSPVEYTRKGLERIEEIAKRLGAKQNPTQPVVRLQAHTSSL